MLSLPDLLDTPQPASIRISGLKSRIAGQRGKGGMSVLSMGEMGKDFCPNFLWIPFSCIGHIMAKRQSVDTTAVVRELANSLDKGSAKKSASQRTICG